MHLPILVLTALVWEAQAILRSLDNVRAAGQKRWEARTGLRQVIVSSGGVGIGSARAVVELSAGQMLLAKAVAMYTGDDRSELKTFPSDPDLLAIANSVALDEGLNPTVGSIFTSGSILSTCQEKEICQRQTSCIAVEMESAVHAEFAARAGVAFLAIRPVLDTMVMSIPRVRGIIGPKGELNMFKALAHLAQHPQELAPLMRLQRCRRLVSTSITTICSALFPALESMIVTDIGTHNS